MSPSILIDNTSDFGNSVQPHVSRTLLLSPPSLSAHPEKLNEVAAAHDRNHTDIQMLDRLSLSLVRLPENTYDLILILTDADNSRTESKKLLSQDVLGKIVKSLKAGGRLHSQDGKFAVDDQEERAEAIFAGLVVEGKEMIRPNHTASESIPLRFGKKKSDGGGVATTTAAGTGAVSLNLNGKRKNGPTEATKPAGVGFIDFSDDLDAPLEEDSDDELIDENTLLDEEDLNRPVVQRKNPPPPGKASRSPLPFAP